MYIFTNKRRNPTHQHHEEADMQIFHDYVEGAFVLSLHFIILVDARLTFKGRRLSSEQIHFLRSHKGGIIVRIFKSAFVHVALIICHKKFYLDICHR